jgi:hypothetical protein
MTVRCGQSGCTDQDEADVCYRTWMVNGLSGCPIRVGASTIAPQVGFMDYGVHFCRQSIQNYPTCATDPGGRPSANNFIWGYSNQNGLSGWVNLNNVTPDDNGANCCGPAGADYHCGDLSRCSSNKCDGGTSGSASSSSGSRTVSASNTYLRYAPGSTAFYYLVSGDTVTRLCIVGSYTCVSVSSAVWCPSGTRGWVLSTSL